MAIIYTTWRGFRVLDNSLGTGWSEMQGDASNLSAAPGGPLDVLIQALADPERGRRRDAIVALGELGDRRALYPLVAVLNGDDRDLRLYAADALGELRDPRAVGALLQVLVTHSPQSFQTEAALNALQAIGEPAVAPVTAASGQSDACVRSGCPRLARPGGGYRVAAHCRR